MEKEHHDKDECETEHRTDDRQGPILGPRPATTVDRNDDGNAAGPGLETLRHSGCSTPLVELPCGTEAFSKIRSRLCRFPVKGREMYDVSA